MVSCNTDLDSIQEYSHPEPLAQTITPTTWQEQLEYAQNINRAKTRASIDDLRLVGYIHKGKINSKEEIPSIIKQLFSENTYIVQYVNDKNFDIIPIKTVMQKTRLLDSNNPFLNTMSQLETSMEIGMELIELEWIYKGNKIHSMAIASNIKGGIIYDSIGSLIIGSVHYSDASTKGLDIKMPTIKTRSEPGTENSTQRIFGKGNKVLNAFGITAAEFNISCVSRFENKILIDRRMESYHNAVIGWSCAADIKTISGELDKSSYHEFAWGYGYGSLSSVNLSFNGFSFSISGGDTGETGTEIHRP